MVYVWFLSFKVLGCGLCRVYVVLRFLMFFFVKFLSVSFLVVLRFEGF